MHGLLHPVPKKQMEQIQNLIAMHSQVFFWWHMNFASSNYWDHKKINLFITVALKRHLKHDQKLTIMWLVKYPIWNTSVHRFSFQNQNTYLVWFLKLTKFDKNYKIYMETLYVGPTELGLRGDQEFLTLMLNLNATVFLG